MPAKAFEPTPQHRELVSRLVAIGVPEDDICTFVVQPHGHPREGKPIDGKTLRKHFRAELDQGLVRANVKVANKLFTAAMNGNTAAMIFWLKSRARWRETNSVLFGDGQGNDLPPPSFNVTFVKATAER